MKKVLILFALSLLFVGCSKNNAKNAAVDYLKKQMKDPSSFKVESAEVLLDTIPLFLNKEMLSAAEDVQESMDEYDRYKDRSYLWADEKSKAQTDLYANMLILKSKHEKLKKEKQPVHYMVLIKCSGHNSYGGTVSSQYIVIVDKDKTDKILGSYRLDSDFAKQIVTYYMLLEDGEHKLKSNSFGKIETDGMTPIEQFIFAEN